MAAVVVVVVVAVAVLASAVGAGCCCCCWLVLGVAAVARPYSISAGRPADNAREFGSEPLKIYKETETLPPEAMTEQDTLIGQREYTARRYRPSLPLNPAPSCTALSPAVIATAMPRQNAVKGFRSQQVQNLLSLFPFCSRAYHAGFVGYNRPHGGAGGGVRDDSAVGGKPGSLSVVERAAHLMQVRRQRHPCPPPPSPRHGTLSDDLAHDLLHHGVQFGPMQMTTETMNSESESIRDIVQTPLERGCESALKPKTLKP